MTRSEDKGQRVAHNFWIRSFVYPNIVTSQIVTNPWIKSDPEVYFANWFFSRCYVLIVSLFFKRILILTNLHVTSKSIRASAIFTNINHRVTFIDVFKNASQSIRLITWSSRTHYFVIGSSLWWTFWTWFWTPCFTSSGAAASRF